MPWQECVHFTLAFFPCFLLNVSPTITSQFNMWLYMIEPLLEEKKMYQDFLLQAMSTFALRIWSLPYLLGTLFLESKPLRMKMVELFLLLVCLAASRLAMIEVNVSKNEIAQSRWGFVNPKMLPCSCNILSYFTSLVNNVGWTSWGLAGWIR